MDSPKIYVNDVSDRPQTSVQHVRKSQQSDKQGKNLVTMAQTKKIRQLDKTRRTVHTKDKPKDSEIAKHLNAHLINLGPQTNKEIESRKFDFGFTAKNTKEGGKKQKKCSIAKSQEKKMHHHNRNQTFHDMSSTINYEPISINYPTTTTNQAGVSNSGKSYRDGTSSM